MRKRLTTTIARVGVEGVAVVGTTIRTTAVQATAMTGMRERRRYR
jgi:hypothetical protein